MAWLITLSRTSQDAARPAAGAVGFVAPAAALAGFGAVLGWLAYINVALALFNLIPGGRSPGELMA